MSEFLKSAMGYFNAPNSGEDESRVTDNDFCGQFVEIVGHKLLVKRVIAEGGFAFVYVAQDVQTGKEYALKRLIGVDKQACNAIINEINIHKQLSGHPNVVAFVGAAFIDKTTGPNQRAEYLLLTELCNGGSLIDCLNSLLEPLLVLRVFYQATRAIAHMHSQAPAITHRDIKIENFLLGNDKMLKLCDFGSATKELFTPTVDWGVQKRNMLEDQLSAVTTPMYRSPEMLDTWSNYEISTKVDVWALGCILYVLCFQKHPFEDAAKLRIVNGNYVLPTDSRYNCFHDIIKGCLNVNPANRFNVSMILERLAALAETRNWSLKGALDLCGKPIEDTPPVTPAHPVLNQPLPNNNNINTAHATSIFKTDERVISQPQPAPMQQQQQQQQPAQVTAANNSLFSSLRGGAGNFLKNLKDTSSRVMQTVQHSIARNDLDISYITSRILVMPCPSEGFESAYKMNNIEDVRLSIESRFPPNKLSVYNFGARSCPRLPPPVRTVEAGSIYSCIQSRAPNLQGMFEIAEDMYGFLTADPKSIVIIQTNDSGGCSAATMVCALLMYAGLLHEPEDAVQVFAVKRHPINLRPSEFRYLYYFGDILRPTPLLPHYKRFNLVSLSCQPVPRMTKSRDGCRIYMEVYCNEHLLLSTVQEFEKMKLYLAGPGKITLPINLTVCGDLTVVLYHARNALKGMVRPQSLKICQFQVHTGFIPELETLINFRLHDLDDIPDAELVSYDFAVSLSLSVTDGESLPAKSPPWLPAKSKRNPQHLFSTSLEFEEMVDNFVAKPTSPPRQITPPMTSEPSTEFQKQNMSRSVSPNAQTLPDVTEIGHDMPTTYQPEPSPPIDLLNLNQPAAQMHLDSEFSAMPTSDASFDLLGAFGDDDSSGIGSAAIPDILVDNAQPTFSAGLDDIFGSLGSSVPNFNFNSFPAPMSKSSSATNAAKMPQSSSTTFAAPPSFTTKPSNIETLPQQSKDPFADIANFASGLNIDFNPNPLSRSKSSSTTPVGNSPHNTQFSSPTHNNMRPQAQSMNNTKPPNGHVNVGITPTPTTAQPTAANTKSSCPSPQSTGQTPLSTQLPRPDYSRNHFDAPKTAQTSTQSKNADIFGDILGSQGYNFGNKMNQGPRSINEMRKEDLVKDMDPDKVKIMEWTEGKKNNIRALLCSMHTILWVDAKWKKCEMSTLITPIDVKKAYRRACLAVHPDKHNGSENEEIAKLVFMELNNAWTDFENDATQQNMFNT